MSTDTHSTDPGTDSDYLTAAGRIAVGGVFVTLSALVLDAFNALLLLEHLTSLDDGEWALHLLGLDRAWLALPLFGVASVPVLAVLDYLRTTGWRADDHWLLASAVLAFVYSVAGILFLDVFVSSTPGWQGETLQYYLSALGVLSAVSAVPMLVGALATRWAPSASPRQLGIAAGAALVLVAIPVGGGAVVDGPGPDAGPDLPEPDSNDSQSNDSDGWMVGASGSRYPFGHTVRLQEARDETPAANVSNLTSYSVRETKQLDGRLVLNSTTVGWHGFFATGLNLSQMDDDRVVSAAFYNGTSSRSAIVDPGSRYPESMDLDVPASLPCEFVLAIDVVEDGQVVRYHAAVDLSAEVDVCR